MKPKVSIIIPCKNEGENINNTMQSIKTHSGSIPYEIIIVDDGSDDGCCDFLSSSDDACIRLLTTEGVHANRARNKGALISRGDILIFCDAHIFVEPEWLEKIIDSLAKPGIDAVSPGLKPHDYSGPAWGGLTWDANMTMRWMYCGQSLTAVPVLPGGCLAVTKEAFAAVGGFDQGFRVYGFEDVEFTLKLWLFGFSAYINPAVTVRHIFREQRPYALSYADIHYNLLRMAFLHFNQTRLKNIIELVKNNNYFAEILSDVILSDIWAERKKYFAERQFDDDWFTQKFNIIF